MTYSHCQINTARRRASLRRATTIAGAVGVSLAAGLGAASASASTVKAHAASGGDVAVFSAGSLDTLVTKKVAPAFKKATGYTLVDTSAGSGTLAADIKDKVDVADVFMSASSADDQILEGAKNGSWVSWYANFATSPYVLGYYPKSKFAKDLRTMPWYDVITMPGFRLGRTNPSQDPGGVLAVQALKQTAAKRHLPALTKLATESSDEYEEDTEEADIQNGQLDASFMYEADARSQNSPFVPLTGTGNLEGKYTITIVKGAPDEAGAQAFVKFMLGKTAAKLLKADKFGTVSPAKVTGSGVPAALKSLF